MSMKPKFFFLTYRDAASVTDWPRDENMFIQDLQIANQTKQIQDKSVCADMNKIVRSQTLRPAYNQVIYSDIKGHKQARTETSP